MVLTVSCSHSPLPPGLNPTYSVPLLTFSTTTRLEPHILRAPEEPERNAAKWIHGAFPERRTGAFERTPNFFPAFQKTSNYAPAFVQIHDGTSPLDPTAPVDTRDVELINLIFRLLRTVRTKF
jgi:hypothetical protein